MPAQRIAVIGGDGIGPEVTEEALKVVAATGADLTVRRFDISARRHLDGGPLITDEEVAELRGHDAILLGAVGDPGLAPGIMERDVLLRLRFEFGLGINLRPARQLPGTTGPVTGTNADAVDMMFVRENTEGPYAGTGGRMRRGTEDELAMQDSVNTYAAIRRAVHYAFELAATRRRSLTWVHKTNVLLHAAGLWQRVIDEQRRHWPDVEVHYLHADAACIHLVQDPARFDVVVTDNLFGDILTDLAGAIAGNIGYLPSACIDPARNAPGLFEPVHGSAPDIAGRGIASPVGAVLSAGLMLAELGHADEAAAIARAVEECARDGLLAGPTTEVGDAIAKRAR